MTRTWNLFFSLSPQVRRTLSGSARFKASDYVQPKSKLLSPYHLPDRFLHAHYDNIFRLAG